jgi:hypothetical protein
MMRDGELEHPISNLVGESRHSSPLERKSKPWREGTQDSVGNSCGPRGSVDLNEPVEFVGTARAKANESACGLKGGHFHPNAGFHCKVAVNA